MSKKFFRLVLALALPILAMSGCTFPWRQVRPAQTPEVVPSAPAATTPVGEANTSKLKKFDNYEQLAEFLAANNNPEASVTRDFMMKNLLAPAAQNTVTGLAAADSSTGGNDQINSLGYSTTNNQVAGVDEPDIIKTDGKYIYALVRKELSIIKAAPADAAAVVSRITFKSRPQDIFIDGNYLAVFGSDNQIYAQAVYAGFRRQNPYTFFKVFDLSDPANPRQVRDLNFEGNYYDARLVGDYVYFLTNTYSRYLANEAPLPRLLDSGQVVANKCEGVQKCFTPEVFYFDIPYDSYSFFNIAAINIKDNSEPLSGQSYLLSSSQNLYVSRQNIYITYTQYLSEYDLEQQVKRELLYPQLSADDQAKITQIETAPGFILNNHEKQSKVAAVIDHYLDFLNAADRTARQTEIDQGLKNKLIQRAKELEKTVVHKIGINGRQLVYRAMGEVNGQALNQFSMDEDGDYFRIATTRSRQYSRFSDLSADSYSNIYVLDANLKTIGSLENLATTEKIYAARFLGDRVYLVTFKQTDPLFVISLKDPAKPTVLGALKIPGFSNYLHPVTPDGSQLLGLGRATEETASGGVKINGLKLSLFDFSDLTKPKELDSFLIGDASSDSIALSDHKAFLYSPEQRRLVIPAVLRDNGRLSFAGALAFNVDNNRLTLTGRVDHSAGGHFAQPDYWDGFDYYDNTVKRSLYIGDDLFTFSNKFLKVNRWGDLSEVKSLELTSGGDDYIITTPNRPEKSASSSPVAAGGPDTTTSTPVASDGTPDAAADTPELPPASDNAGPTADSTSTGATSTQP
ncbi:MAG: beta-propeller domain-containing protein [Patescibacteria group bacterium]